MIMTEVFADIKPVFNESEGNSGYGKELSEIMSEALSLKQAQIKFSYAVSADSARC